MAKRSRGTPWAKALRRGMLAMARLARAATPKVAKPPAKAARRKVRQASQALVGQALAPLLGPAVARRKPPSGPGNWLPGLAVGASGARRYRLYRPPGVGFSERLPLMVMLHGCTQDAAGFAASTRMNTLARRERFLVLYPEQDRLANAQGCWNWFNTDNGRAQAEAALILQAVDQACRLYPVDAARVVVAGLSAGASMAALLATLHPGRFQAVVMHSGVPPGTAHSTLTALGAMQGRRSTAAMSPRAGAAGHWPPLLVVHGDADGVVAPANGRAAAQAWADAAGAVAGPPRRVQRGQRRAAMLTDFKLQGRTVATLVMVDGLGHAWSGGAAGQPFSDATGPDAARMAWAFAARQWAS